MKKTATWILILLLALGGVWPTALAEAAQTNAQFDEKGMVSITGRQIDIADSEYLVGNVYTGFAFLQPKAWEALKDETLASLSQTDDSVRVDYLPEAHKATLEKMARTADDEEWAALADEVEENLIGVLCLFRVSADDAAAEETVKDYQAMFGRVEPIARDGKATYYLAYHEQFPDCSLSDNDRADMTAIAGGAAEIREGLMLYPPQEFTDAYGGEESFYEEPPLEADLTAISARDMDGNAFTPDDFARYDLTVVNVWATYCGPCLEEMDDLVRLQGLLPENVNLVTICTDAADDMQLARDILSSVDAKFTTLVGDEGLRESLLNNVLGVPTTLFVDKDGNMVGEHIVGAPEGEDTAQAYLNLVDQRLEALR